MEILIQDKANGFHGFERVAFGTNIALSNSSSATTSIQFIIGSVVTKTGKRNRDMYRIGSSRD